MLYYDVVFFSDGKYNMELRDLYLSTLHDIASSVGLSASHIQTLLDLALEKKNCKFYIF